VGGDSFDKHGEDFTGIALPVPAMEEYQARCRRPLSRVEVEFCPLARAVGNVQRASASGSQFGRRLVSRSYQRSAVRHGFIIVVGGVTLDLR
jgi:hypothetical protein